MSKPELALYAKSDGTGRAYKHPFRTLGEDAKGKPRPLSSPSVTTILKLVDKSGLSQWAADMTVQWAIENASLLLGRSDDQIRAFGRYRWTDVRDQRAEVGTGIHETIEAIHTGGWNYPVLDDEQRRIMEQWDLLNQRYQITPKLSEFTVWNVTDDYAGTADGLWDITDTWTGQSWENVVVDIKTSNKVWPEHWMQLAALARAEFIMEKQADGTWVERNMPANVSGATAIIHLKQDVHEILIEDDWNLTEIRYNKFHAYNTAWHIARQEKEILDARAKASTGGF